MAAYQRHYYKEVMERLQEQRRFIQVLAGPRQVGKSTLMGQICQGLEQPYLMVSADGVDSSDRDWINRSWETARARKTVAGSDTFVLIIDEVQKINNWSERVKREWDSDTMTGTNIKVVLLGSSRLLLKAGLTESLAGRFELIRMGHWSYSEMKDAFGMSLDQYIYYGGYPGSAPFISNHRRWQRYVKDALIAPAIEKDVIMTTNIYKPALMKQLFELGCAYSSELLSLTKMLGQLQDAGNVTTLAEYLSVLRECALLTGLQKYSVDKARKYNSVPKYQVYNNALLTAYSGKNYETDRIDPMRWGRWVESAVGAHLVSNAEESGYDVFYWRERDDEVDFIITKYGEAVALEVKSGRRGMNSGIPAFSKLFHPKRSLIIGTGGLPMEDFLGIDPAELF